jgi:hypothetical protein
MSDANLPSPNNLGYLGSADPTTVGDHFNALSFIAKQVLSGAWTVTGDCLGDLGGAARAAVRRLADFEAHRHATPPVCRTEVPSRTSRERSL